MPPGFDDMLASAEEAVRAAGRELVERFAGSLDVRWKTYRGERTVVTDADFAADAAIRRVLQRDFPDHVIFSEEEPHDDIYGSDVWVVDPLDGTDNYSRGQPQFCVSVAHASGGRVDLGVVFDPIRDEFFSATANGPATCNGKVVAVTDCDSPELSSVAWAQMGITEDDTRRFHRALVLAAATFHRVRMTGSAALEMVWVAAGRYDAALFSNVKWWDHAAGALIVQRAGGRSSDLYGRPTGSTSRRCVFSNGHLHEAVVSLARDQGLHLPFAPTEIDLPE